MYFITTFTKFNKDGNVDQCEKRTVGYYRDLDVAIRVVAENRCDIYEDIYDYAVIEYLLEGLYPEVEKRILFHIDIETRKYKIQPNCYLLDGYPFPFAEVG
jgi:hypothetical protein